MTVELAQLKRRPTPSSADAQARKRGYRQDVAIADDSAVFHEPCVEATAIGLAGVNHYNTPFNPPYNERIPGAIDGLYVRKSVGDALLAVNARLAGAALELYLFEAWRPQAVQRHFHDVWFPAWLRQRAPHLDGQELVDEVEKYWAAPSEGDASPSAHSTGGAADRTLRFKATGQPTCMGGLFDEVTEAAWTLLLYTRDSSQTYREGRAVGGEGGWVAKGLPRICARGTGVKACPLPVPRKRDCQYGLACLALET